MSLLLGIMLCSIYMNLETGNYISADLFDENQREKTKERPRSSYLILTHRI